MVLKKTKSGWEEAVLEKTKGKEVLEKTPKVMKMPKAMDLEKSFGKKLLVVVDWHHTLKCRTMSLAEMPMP